MTRVVVATGTRREAATLRGSGWTVIAGGGDEARLRAELDAAANGAEAILSFGMAGALVDDLAIGDWVIGDRVTGAVEATCDPGWRDRLAATMSGARVGAIYADGRMVASVAEKRSLARAHGALVVDMESHVAAAFARERGLALAVVRCVSDQANHELPPAIVAVMRPGGGLDWPAVARSLLARPGQMPSLVRTLAGFARAMRALERGAPRIGA